jgi:dihydroflavonol-4-reductase
MWFAKATSGMSELYYRILERTPLYTAYSLYTLSSNSNFSHEKADRELGYTTRPMVETVSDTVDWLRTQNRL